MTPAKIDLTIYQGATFRKEFVLKVNDTVFDLTGYTARMQARERCSSDSALLTLTTENAGITIDGAAGKITLFISATDTAAITYVTAVYDLELISGPEVLRFSEGRITVSKEITR